MAELSNVNSSAALAERAELYESRWYAAYTYPRHERKVAEQLNRKSVESFLPLYTTVRRWNDRRAELELPLFPGYIFVRIPLIHRVQVLEVPGVVRLVSFQRQPVALPDHELERLRESIAIRKAEPCPFLIVGRRVRIVKGPLQGLEGIIQRRKNRTRLVVSVECITHSMAVELEACDLELATARHLRSPFQSKPAIQHVA